MRSTLHGLFLLATCLSGCGYHSLEKFNQEKVRIEMPFIQGDQDGQFTKIFIRNLANAGGLEYVQSQGNYRLEIVIVNQASEHIGYIYDREKATGILIKRLEPSEGRRTLGAEVRLLDRLSGHVVEKPFFVEAYVDFDFVNQDSTTDVSFIDQEGKRVSVLAFSLGQLDSEEGAKDAAKVSLYQLLSEKIIEGLQLRLFFP